jgi:hypothetical protein
MAQPSSVATGEFKMKMTELHNFVRIGHFRSL